MASCAFRLHSLLQVSYSVAPLQFPWCRPAVWCTPKICPSWMSPCLLPCSWQCSDGKGSLCPPPPLGGPVCSLPLQGARGTALPTSRLPCFSEPPRVTSLPPSRCPCSRQRCAFLLPAVLLPPVPSLLLPLPPPRTSLDPATAPAEP